MNGKLDQEIAFRLPEKPPLDLLALGSTSSNHPIFMPLSLEETATEGEDLKSR